MPMMYSEVAVCAPSRPKPYLTTCLLMYMHATLSPAHRLKSLIQAKMDMLGQAKAFFHTLNGGEVIANPTLDWGVVGYPSRESQQLFPMEYHWKNSTGTLDEMFGGFGTLEPNGQWNASTMNISITAILKSIREYNATVLVRGYPGPCGVPFMAVNASCVGSDTCPKTGPSAGVKKITVPTWPPEYPTTQPTTVQGLKDAASKLIVQALAPYLIIAGPSTWWSYGYFYGPDSGWYVCHDNPDSCLAPATWYPELAKKLGAPLAPPQNDGAWKWTRSFEYATVSVDLQDSTASSVVFHNGHTLE
eukprot:m.84423 g.84423  ORF g.84423 m.84423 type:complete len:303 (-) comp9595_c0_seq1:883-1791(-)